MRNLSKSERRATQDIDLDFIRYSISDESIRAFIGKLNQVDGLRITLSSAIKELNHQDYSGKRIFVDIVDEYDYHIEGKIDIGVHKDLASLYPSSLILSISSLMFIKAPPTVLHSLSIFLFGTLMHILLQKRNPCALQDLCNFL